jgi:hypothetical protein
MNFLLTFVVFVITGHSTHAFCGILLPKMTVKQKLQQKLKVTSKPTVETGGKDFVVTTGQSARGNRGKWFAVGSIILIVAVVAGVMFVNHHHSVNSMTKERDALVTQAAAFPYADQTSKLAPIVTQIEQQPGFDKDADCLYVLTAYYVHTSDLNHAKTYYVDLAKVYNSKVGYRNANLKNMTSLKDLQLSITSMSTLLQQAQTNSNNLSPRPVR